MLAGNDPTPWNLLHDGKLVRIVRTGSSARLRVEIPHLRARFEPPGDAFVLHLHGIELLGYLPYSDRWDEPLIVDPAAIVAASPTLIEAEPHEAEHGDLDRARMIVWGSLGSLRLTYAGLTIELDTGFIGSSEPTGRPVSLAELSDANARFWQDWRAHWTGHEVHPLVRSAMHTSWTPELLTELIEAWQRERTSDLAATIAIIDEALRDRAPSRLADEVDVERWRATWTSAPGAALAELGRAARASWDILLGDTNEIPYDERARANAARWDQLRRCVATLVNASSDPRVGRAIEEMLRGPSACWFHVDQVGHVAEPFEAPDDQPSFADHALPLLAVHGDAGSVARLRELARRLLIEADCNDAEMAERLTALAEQLERRWPHDRAMPDAVEQALRHRRGS